jgi:hypothetical protein
MVVESSCDSQANYWMMIHAALGAKTCLHLVVVAKGHRDRTEIAWRSLS